MPIIYTFAYWYDLTNFSITKKSVQRKTDIKNLLPTSVSQAQIFIDFFCRI